MTKGELLLQLEKKLGQLSPEDRRRHLEYYSELIDDMTEDGMAEFEAVASLGDAADLANEILGQTPLPVLMKTAVKPKNGWSVWSIVLIVLGFPVWLPLLAALGVIVLAVYIVIWSVVVVLFAAVLAIFAGALGCFFLAFWAGSMANALLLVGGGLVCSGLGLLAVFGAVAVTKLLAQLTVCVAKGIKSLFIKKEADA